MDGQTRRTALKLLALATVKAAEKEVGRWHEPFPASTWPAIFYNGIVYTVGRNDDYESFRAREDAVEALMAGWASAADETLSEGWLSQAEIDSDLAQALRDSVGILI